MRTSAWVRAVAVALALAPVACATPQPAPPAAPPITSAELETRWVRWSMSLFAHRIHRLNRLLAAHPEGLSTAELREAHRLLEDVEDTAEVLEGPGETPHHPLVGGQIHWVREAAHVARVAAELDPPNLDPAHHLVGECTRCHELR